MRSRKSQANVEALELLSIPPSDSEFRTNDVLDLISQKASNIRFCRSYIPSYQHITVYILACLHVEPEANICPMGHKYQDQLKFLVQLDAICQINHLKLIVKEHPFQLGLPVTGLKANLHVHRPSSIMPRPLHFYREIQKLKSFAGFSIDVTVESHFDNPNIKAVASVGGAVTLQAAVKGILAITGVDTWYKDIPNVVSIDNCLDEDIFTSCNSVDEDTFIKSILPYVFSSSFSGQNESYFQIEKLSHIALGS